MFGFRKSGLIGLVCLLFLAVTAKGAEVREEELDGPGDALFQLQEIRQVLAEVGRKSSPRSRARTQVIREPSIFVGDETPVAAVKPLVPGNRFNPRLFGGAPKPPVESPWVKPDPKRDGVVGDAKVKFGERKDISLATIAQNNAAAVDAIAKAASAEPDFVNPAIEDNAEVPAEKTFEQKLEELSERETPFSVQDYVEFREFVSRNEEAIWKLPNQDSRFHENLKALYKQFGGKDADPKAGQALRRVLGVDPADTVKTGATKKPSTRANRTH